MWMLDELHYGDLPFNLEFSREQISLRWKSLNVNRQSSGSTWFDFYSELLDFKKKFKILDPRILLQIWSPKAFQNLESKSNGTNLLEHGLGELLSVYDLDGHLLIGHTVNPELNQSCN